METNGPREIITAMKKLASLLVFLTLGLPALGAEWQLVKEDSSLTFSGLQLGQGFDGRIEEFSASICFDESDLDGAEVVLDINLTSITTGIADRDEILAAEEWLDTARYPKAEINIRGVNRIGPNSYVAEAEITIKGTTQVMPLSFTLNLIENTAQGEVTIDRRDFKIGDGEWGKSEKWVGFPITIGFHFSAQMTERNCHE